jgi:hypothetical protein
MLLFLARLLRVLVALLLVRLVMRSLGGFFRARRVRQGPAEPPAVPPGQVGAGELVRDRVCNTFLPRERAVCATIDGREEHFCSAACRDQALAGAAHGMRVR